MIRKAEREDLGVIMGLVDEARMIMRASGNYSQWTSGYPGKNVILSDMERDGAYVICRGEENAVVGYFAMFPSPDPTYDYIEGAWMDDEPYLVIHRLSSGPSTHGILHEALEYAFSIRDEVRIDTHEDNAIMRHLMAKEGFTECGTIYLENGDPRLAFEKNNSRE